ncbi:MAG: aminotransferase class III-fold pyridoxal phosphate-dependent enzyme [Chloroflexota bacterium]
MTNPIVDRYVSENQNSRALYAKAVNLLPGGIAHDIRRQDPFPFYIVRGAGARKWDADGHELIDYGMGHGALLLGHAHPTVTRAVAEALRDGTHFSAGHPMELMWAERIQRLVPSAELVRFVASGTEATMMAMRLARAFTGRAKIVRFPQHFHGWHDYASVGWQAPAQNEMPGIPDAVRGTMVLCQLDLNEVEDKLKGGDIAAVILEAAGAGSGTVPLPDGFQAGLRALTTKYDVVLIFDEVVTGFRWSPGGVQKKIGVTPDLTTMAKIVAGGLPGGAVGGRRDIMEQLRFKDKEWNVKRKFMHNGTFNANPLSAAAAVACLDIIADGKAQAFADTQAATLRAGLNAIMNRLEVEGAAWGESSAFHMALGVPVPARGDGDLRDPQAPPAQLHTSPVVDQALQLEMLHHGVHLFHGGGLLSVAHDDQVIEQTLQAFEQTLVAMQEMKLV